MTKLGVFVLAPLVLMLTAATAWGQTSGGPETVLIHSGSATLRAMLYRPPGRGPFPGILLNHGSGRTPEDLKRLGPYEQNGATLGPVFARHGYAFLYLFRRGVGLSTDQGANAVDLMPSPTASSSSTTAPRLPPNPLRFAPRAPFLLSFTQPRQDRCVFLSTLFCSTC